MTDRQKQTLIEKIKDRGPAVGYKFTNYTRNTKHIYVPLRTYSPKEQEEHDKQVEEMLQKHIIARTRSLLSTPVLLVKKKDNNHRVVVDYTKLNEKTENDNFPLTIPRKHLKHFVQQDIIHHLTLDWDICRKSQQEGCSKSSIQHKNRGICIFKNGNGIERGLSSFSKVHERDFCRSHAPRNFVIY